MTSIKFINRLSGEIHQEIVPSEKWLKWLYFKPLGKLALNVLVKRKFLSEWYGRKMDSPASSSKIPEFINNLKIDMSEASQPTEAFKTFNDFFIRELKPEVRPIDSSENSIVSPADGKIVAFNNMDSMDTFFAKGQEFSLESFLEDKSLSQKYEGGHCSSSA